MATLPPAPIPFPTSTFPGSDPQESSGRLVNCSAEPLSQEHTGPAGQVIRVQPGLSFFARTNPVLTGYRGGLFVNNTSYEVWKDTLATFDLDGNETTFVNPFPGTQMVSIARNQNAVVNIIAVDPDNGAYLLTGGGAPSLYTGTAGSLPQPNSVSFQAGYFFFTIADCRVFATGVNNTAINALTFTAINSKADVTLLRGIAFSGVMWFFTTGSCEIWQNTAQPSPGFPYSYQVTLETGLLQINAIAGMETGFGSLLWVSNDFGVYQANSANQLPQKVSPPDLDRFISKAHRRGDKLEAGCYVFDGKRYWTISGTNFTWEFNLNSQRWNERSSLRAGVYTRFRARGGHLAFGKWIVGDEQTGCLLYHDPDNWTEFGTPLLFRVESGPVEKFPVAMRIARADFDVILGNGVAVGNFAMTITNAISGTAVPGGNLIRLTVKETSRALNNDIVLVSGVTGTVEANGTWPITLIDDTHIELQGSKFVSAYITGGVALDVTSQPNNVAPTWAVSCSKDGGNTWDVPSVRAGGQQGRSLRARVSVKNRGQSSLIGVRWRLDCTDAVYRALLKGTMSNNPRDPG